IQARGTRDILCRFSDMLSRRYGPNPVTTLAKTPSQRGWIGTSQYFYRNPRPNHDRWWQRAFSPPILAQARPRWVGLEIGRTLDLLSWKEIIEITFATSRALEVVPDR